MPRVVTSLATGKTSRDKENVSPYRGARPAASSKDTMKRGRHDVVSEGDHRRGATASSSSSSSRIKTTTAPRLLKRRTTESEDGNDSRDQSVEMRRDIPGSASKRHLDHATNRSNANAMQAKVRNGSGSSNGRNGFRSDRPLSRVDAQSQHDVDNDQAALYEIAIKERDEVQGQFNALQKLRSTEPERLLAEWKRAAEGHNCTTDAYIAQLKKQVDALESAASRSSGKRDDRGDREIDNLRQALHDSEKREAKLQDELERARRQAKERAGSRDNQDDGTATSRLALRAHVGSGALGAGDERAVRRLYEDLTGLVVNKVEEASEGTSKSGRGDRDALRRFHAIFACAGYHDLEIKLEESTSSLPSTLSGSSRDAERRQDFVYTPVFDKERDADLLQSGRLPDYLRESIRFERSTAVKFLNTLHKRLDRHAKK